MLTKFNIYPNAYYNHLKNRKAAYREKKAEMQRAMVETYHDEDGVPGYRMLHDLLYNKFPYSEITYWKYMHELDIRSIVRRKSPAYIKGQQHHIFPNLLNRNFKVSGPNQVWCTDFTYLIWHGIKRYNCTIIDLYRREVVASLNSAHIDSELAKNTLKLAISRRKPKKGLILHSDQGRQFASEDFIKLCKKHHIQQSMSKAGCPYDNAPMERFYNTLKNEYFNIHTFKSLEELDQGIYDFVYVKYNYKRPHRYNGGQPPCAA